MQVLILLIIIAIFLAIPKDGKFSFPKPKESRLPYRRKSYLLSIAEKSFYAILKQIADNNNWAISPKVRLEDLLWIPSGTENRFGLRNRIKSRHIDFVLCDKEAMSPLLAIELDDASHEREDRVERDRNVDRILQDAGLPILHIKVQSFYDEKIISKQILDLLKIPAWNLSVANSPHAEKYPHNW